MEREFYKTKELTIKAFLQLDTDAMHELTMRAKGWRAQREEMERIVSESAAAVSADDSGVTMDEGCPEGHKPMFEGQSSWKRTPSDGY